MNKENDFIEGEARVISPNEYVDPSKVLKVSLPEPEEIKEPPLISKFKKTWEGVGRMSDKIEEKEKLIKELENKARLDKYKKELEVERQLSLLKRSTRR